MANRRALKIAFSISGSFVCLAVGIVFLGATQIVTPAVGLLMLVALLGLYVGFGVLIAVYRLVNSLD
jgi:xanthosine utilization system XapX-like protein